MKLNTFVAQPMSVRVVVPYVEETPLLQTVVDSLRIQFVQPEMRQLSVKDDEGYHRLLAELWSEGREFFIVEHDTIPWCGGIKYMADCPEAWCTMPQICRGRIIDTAFGCVKFGQHLIDLYPNLWDDIPSTPWFRQDAGFAIALRGTDPHVHYPAAIHMNELHWPAEISNRFQFRKVWQVEQADLVGHEILRRMGWQFLSDEEEEPENVELSERSK